MMFRCKLLPGSGSGCQVKNTRGEPEEGIYLTAEAPPVVNGTEVQNAGITSLPWTGELIERETGLKQVLTHHLKLWFVLPPASVGIGEACAGTEVEYEDREGQAEKEAGYELAPIWVNGKRNGLQPSHCLEAHLDEGLTEKGFPITGRLSSPQLRDGLVGLTKSVCGGMGAIWELVTAEGEGFFVGRLEAKAALKAEGPR